MEYDVIYSDRKSIGIKVKNGRVTVRAPHGTKMTYINDVVKKHNEWIKNALLSEKLRRHRYEELTESQIQDLKTEAKSYFEEKCAYYSKLMNLKHEKLTITSAKTRFGSCSSKKSICFSYRLMLYPEKAREYVVVHELAHLIEMNHSQGFYRIIESYMPDYRERRKFLKIQKADPK